MDHFFVRLLGAIILLIIFNAIRKIIYRSVNRQREKKNKESDQARDTIITEVKSLIQKGEIDHGLWYASAICIKTMEESDSFFSPEIFNFYYQLLDIIRTHAGTIINDFDRKSVDLAISLFVDLSNNISYPEKEITRATDIITSLLLTILKKTDPDNNKAPQPLEKIP